jgi:ABC-type ATPase with predicted acetyltransferase domain
MEFFIHRESEINDNSFRVSAIKGTFDLSRSKIEENFRGEIVLPDDWRVGVIYGQSGTGKSTIARELFGEQYFRSPEYGASSVIDDMPKAATIDMITQMFTSVGFGSTPSWLKPYSVLSNGEKMRVDLARSLLSDSPMIVFDEFTSVIDRHIAKIGSMCVQKTIRKGNKRFIAVSCHDDILEWLEPDWAFCTDSMVMVDHKKKDQKLNCVSCPQAEMNGSCLAVITI